MAKQPRIVDSSIIADTDEAEEVYRREDIVPAMEPKTNALALYNSLGADIPIPPHIAAIGIKKGMSFEEVAEKGQIRDSYVSVDTIELGNYINRTMRVIGIWPHHVPYFTSKKTGEINTHGYDEILLKLDRVLEDLDGNKYNAIVSSNAKAIYELASEILVPVAGWGDWKDPEGNPKGITLHITKPGNAFMVKMVR